MAKKIAITSKKEQIRFGQSHIIPITHWTSPNPKIVMSHCASFFILMQHPETSFFMCFSLIFSWCLPLSEMKKKYGIAEEKIWYSCKNSC